MSSVPPSSPSSVPPPAAASAGASATNSLAAQIAAQVQRVQALHVSVFSQIDPAGNEALLAQLAQAEGVLADLRAQLKAANAASPPTGLESVVVEALASGVKVSRTLSTEARGRFLGARTTGLNAAVTIKMDPLPTSAYHLMDPNDEPLLTVDIENSSRDIRRVCVKAYLEGLSATAVRTVEIEPRKSAQLRLQPTLFPDRAREITEVQRATLHVIVADLDGKLESHDTYPITCLARSASFNAVRRPDTGELLDLSHYYGAWVTPHIPAVQHRIRRAVELTPNRQMLGYQGDPDQVTDQVGALYQSLREAEIAYVNSVIDYGAPAGMTTQRTRLPRESLEQCSANCIDGTVLLASLLEGVSLNPAIVLVPGHALLAWEKWPASDEWQCLETTLIGSADFAAAMTSGQRQFEQYNKFSPQKIKRHVLSDLRARGIWPME